MSATSRGRLGLPAILTIAAVLELWTGRLTSLRAHTTPLARGLARGAGLLGTWSWTLGLGFLLLRLGQSLWRVYGAASTTTRPPGAPRTVALLFALSLALFVVGNGAALFHGLDAAPPTAQLLVELGYLASLTSLGLWSLTSSTTLRAKLGTLVLLTPFALAMAAVVVRSEPLLSMVGPTLAAKLREGWARSLASDLRAYAQSAWVAAGIGTLLFLSPLPLIRLFTPSVASGLVAGGTLLVAVAGWLDFGSTAQLFYGAFGLDLPPSVTLRVIGLVVLLAYGLTCAGWLRRDVRDTRCGWGLVLVAIAGLAGELSPLFTTSLVGLTLVATSQNAINHSEESS